MHEEHYCWKKAWDKYWGGRESEDRTWRRGGDGTDRKRERRCLDVGLIQAQASECFTRSDSPLCKHNLTVSKKKLDPKFNYLGTPPHSWVLRSRQDWLRTASALTDERNVSSSYCCTTATEVALESEELIPAITYFPKYWLLLTGIALITAGLSQPWVRWISTG